MTQPRRPNRVSIRLRNWDYASNAWYFVTICTRDRQLFFGDIVSETMQLSAIGETAQQFWLDLPDHFSYVSLDAHVVMPNHLHGILGIDRPYQATDNADHFKDCKPYEHRRLFRTVRLSHSNVRAIAESWNIGCRFTLL
jgi:REP element-mobilizing transposase RayT